MLNLLISFADDWHLRGIVNLPEESSRIDPEERTITEFKLYTTFPARMQFCFACKFEVSITFTNTSRNQNVYSYFWQIHFFIQNQLLSSFLNKSISRGCGSGISGGSGGSRQPPGWPQLSWGWPTPGRPERPHSQSTGSRRIDRRTSLMTVPTWRRFVVAVDQVLDKYEGGQEQDDETQMSKSTSGVVYGCIWSVPVPLSRAS
jgi:hypothetical protein